MTTATEPAAVSAPPACTPSDLSISTSPAQSTYPGGAVIDLTTQLRALYSPCELDPVAIGTYNCGTSIVVNGPAGSQVWPMQNQGEECAQPAPTVLQPGYGEEVTVSWNGELADPSSGTVTDAQAGQYQAFGTWTWSAGIGLDPYSFTGASEPFNIY